MGEVVVPHIDTLTALKEPVEKWYPLGKRKPKHEVSGDILIRLSFREGVCNFLYTLFKIDFVSPMQILLQRKPRFLVTSKRA